MLGSFSNYLISNSSVPVMVARHKLQRQLSNKQANKRLANNLTAPKSLLEKARAEAKAKARARAKAWAEGKVGVGKGEAKGKEKAGEKAN